MQMACLALSSFAVVASGCPAGESAACEGDAVFVQAFNDTTLAVEIQASVSGTTCDGKGVVRRDSPPTHLLDMDLVAGQVVHYDILEAGGQSIDCTVDQEGVDITYVRARLNAVGVFECECGFQEYYDADPENNRGSCV